MIMAMQSQDIFQPNGPCVWPDQIRPDKYTIHYQWKFIEFTKENEYPDSIFSPYHKHCLAYIYIYIYIYIYRSVAV